MRKTFLLCKNSVSFVNRFKYFCRLLESVVSMRKTTLGLIVVFMCFLVGSAVPAFAWAADAGATSVVTEQPAYVGSGYAPTVQSAINVTEIMELINSVLPLLLTLAIIGALFGAIGKMTRKF